jgi:hypothetical protein
MPRIATFRGRTGSIFVQRENPWTNLSGKFGEIVKKGLARPKKGSIILVTPPPWFFDRKRLSPAQKAVNQIFGEIQRRTAGMPLDKRFEETKKEMTNLRIEVEPIEEANRIVYRARIMKLDLESGQLQTIGERIVDVKMKPMPRAARVPAVAPARRGLREVTEWVLNHIEKKHS